MMAIAAVIMVAAFLLLTFLLLLPAASSYASSGNEWKTAYMVGKFLNAEPPKPDQIFKIQYRVVNGTVEDFSVSQQVGGYLISNSIAVKVKSRDGSKGVLEINFPRNFPYTNSMSGGGNFHFFADDQNIIADVTAKTDCFYTLKAPFTGSTEIELVMPSILIKSPYYGDKVDDSCTTQTVVSDVPTREDGTISPLHQFRAGVAAGDILCREKLELVIDPAGKPYCAMQHTAKILKERWNLQQG